MAVKKQMSEAQIEKVTNETGAALKEQKKVKVKLYLSPAQKKRIEADEKAGKQVNWPYQTVAINGYNFQIQLGKEVEVPEAVAEILEQAGMM